MNRSIWLKRPMMYLALAGAFALAFAACNDNPPPAPAAPPAPGQAQCPPMSVTVSIPANATGLGAAAFGANPLIVGVGAEVKWVNNDTLDHTVTSDDGIFGSFVLETGDDFEIEFEEVGTFPYFCAIHGKDSMSGVVQVVAQPPGCPVPSPSASPSETPSPEPSETPSPEPSETPSPVPSESPSPTPSASPSAAPSVEPAGIVTVAIPQGATGMGPAAYGTNPFVIAVGSQVVWVNNDSAPHTATSDSGAFDTGNLAAGQQSSPIPFNMPGDYPYYCTIHGRASMSGMIRVQ